MASSLISACERECRRRSARPAIRRGIEAASLSPVPMRSAHGHEQGVVVGGGFPRLDDAIVEPHEDAFPSVLYHRQRRAR